MVILFLAPLPDWDGLKDSIYPDKSKIAFKPRRRHDPPFSFFCNLETHFIIES